MKVFWALFKKEFRFLRGPGIVMLVLITVGLCLGTIISYYSPDYLVHSVVKRDTGEVYNDVTFVAKYLVGPLVHGPSEAREYIYALIFLYAVLYENITRSKYQFFMLPASRWTHLVANYCAVVAWALLILVVMFILRNVFNIMIAGYGISPVLVVIYATEDISTTLAICALAMLAYVVALSVRRWRYLVGIVTFIAGYLFMGRMYVIVSQYIARHSGPLHYSDGIPTLLHMVVWKLSISNSIVAFLFFTSAFMLYERTSEV